MITVVILAFNEEKNLKELLPSLDWANKVVVIDDYSTDGTALVCDKFTNVVCFKHKVHDHYAQARNFGLTKIDSGWVLFLDADERLAKKSVDLILSTIKKKDGTQGYYLPRVDIFHGREMRWGEFNKMKLLRLGKVDSGRWRGRVHEVWEIDDAKDLNATIFHHAHNSISQLFGEVKTYAKYRADELASEGKGWSLFEQIAYPLLKFLFLFVWQRGFLDGWRGFIFCVAMAYHSFLVRWYLWDGIGNTSWHDRITKYLVLLPLLLFPFGQLFRGVLFGIPIYVHEIFMVLAVMLVNFRRVKWRDNFLLLLFSLILGLSFLMSVYRGYSLEGGLYLMRWFLYVGYLFALFDVVNKRLAISIDGILAYIGSLVITLGFVQYVLFPDVRSLALLGWDDHYYRMVGSFFDPNFLGLLFVLIVVWSWFRFAESKALSLFLLFGASFGLLATFSRASWLSLLLVEVVFLWNKKKVVSRRGFAWLFGVFLLFSAVFLLLPRPGGEGINLFRVYSIESRLSSWTQGVEVFFDSPFLGIGYNQYPALLQSTGRYGVEYLPKSPDNSFVFVMATSGLLGMCSFFGLLVFWFKNYRSGVARLSLMAILIHSLFNNSFFYPFVLLWWWMILVAEKQRRIVD